MLWAYINMNTDYHFLKPSERRTLARCAQDYADCLYELGEALGEVRNVLTEVSPTEGGVGFGRIGVLLTSFEPFGASVRGTLKGNGLLSGGGAVLIL